MEGALMKKNRLIILTFLVFTQTNLCFGAIPKTLLNKFVNAAAERANITLTTTDKETLKKGLSSLYANAKGKKEAIKSFLDAHRIIKQRQQEKIELEEAQDKLAELQALEEGSRDLLATIDSEASRELALSKDTPTQNFPVINATFDAISLNTQEMGKHPRRGHALSKEIADARTAGKNVSAEIVTGSQDLVRIINDNYRAALTKLLELSRFKNAQEKLITTVDTATANLVTPAKGPTIDGIEFKYRIRLRTVPIDPKKASTAEIVTGPTRVVTRTAKIYNITNVINALPEGTAIASGKEFIVDEIKNTPPSRGSARKLHVKLQNRRPFNWRYVEP